MRKLTISLLSLGFLLVGCQNKVVDTPKTKEPKQIIYDDREGCIYTSDSLMDKAINIIDKCITNSENSGIETKPFDYAKYLLEVKIKEGIKVEEVDKVLKELGFNRLAPYKTNSYLFINLDAKTLQDLIKTTGTIKDTNIEDVKIVITDFQQAK